MPMRHRDAGCGLRASPGLSTRVISLIDAGDTHPNQDGHISWKSVY